MDSVHETLTRWGEHRCQSVDVGGLLTRNAIAHKWKAPFRSMVIRETALWRVHDLLLQSLTLYEAGKILGARILLRSALETTAVLIYLNHLMSSVIAGSENFHEFALKTSRLLLGSKNRSTQLEAINLLTVLRHAEKRHAGVTELFSDLSESAHPNFEGMGFGYSRVDHEQHVSNFGGYLEEMFLNVHEPAMQLCVAIFEYEYNEEWPRLFEEFEDWIVRNDDELERTKDCV